MHNQTDSMLTDKTVRSYCRMLSTATQETLILLQAEAHRRGMLSEYEQINEEISKRSL